MDVEQRLWISFFTASDRIRSSEEKVVVEKC